MPSDEVLANWPAEALELAERLKSFGELDGRDGLPGREAALGFLRRLARDNQWSIAYAERAFSEYLRFVFLARVHDEPVTPSDQVDQVWHLHLQYSRNYWTHFCPKVLQRILHHGPTRGGSSEGVKWTQQYADTRAAYARWFGQPAPVDLWPGARIRFGRDTRWVRVNRDDVWLLPRPSRWLPRMAAAAGALTTALALQAPGFAFGAASPRPVSGPYGLSGSQFLGFLAGMSALGWLLAWRLSSWLGFLRSGRARRVPFDLYLYAWTKGGPRRVVQTALARLLEDGRISHSTASGFKPIRRPRNGTQIELLVFDGLGSRTPPRQLQKEQAAIERTAFRLGIAGNGPKWTRWALVLLPVAIAGPRLAQGLERGRPVGLLVILTLALVAIGIAVKRRPVSILGRAWARRFDRSTDRSPTLAVAREGLRGARDTALDDLWQAGRFRSSNPSWTTSEVAHADFFIEHDSDGGGDDGGSDSGCGGGGCGGCGGD